MENHQTQFIVDQQGNRTAVLLDIQTYQRILEQLEELESLKAYDAAKADDGEIIPFEQAVAEIENHR
jgi:hypothetical protein